MNAMQQIKIEKLTLNIGAGRDEKVLQRAVKLLKHITGVDPVQTVTNKRLAAWGLRPGLPIGAKITLRDQEKILGLVKRLFASKEYIIKKSWFDNNGNISFGIHEYVDIPDVRYETDIGMLGLQVCITLTRPGFRVKRRKIRKGKLGKAQMITQENAMKFAIENFKLKMEDEQ